MDINLESAKAYIEEDLYPENTNTITNLVVVAAALTVFIICIPAALSIKNARRKARKLHKK